jgi:hypothetical protein
VLQCKIPNEKGALRLVALHSARGESAWRLRLSGSCLNLKPEAHTRCTALHLHIPDVGMLILISQLKERLQTKRRLQSCEAWAVEEPYHWIGGRGQIALAVAFNLSA